MTGGRLDASILRQLLIALAMIVIMLAAPARPVAVARARQGGADAGRRIDAGEQIRRSRPAMSVRHA